MMQVHAGEEAGATIEWRGLNVVLVEQVWSLRAGTGHWSGEITYHRPARVEAGDGQLVKITDHSMLIRLASSVALLTAILLRKAR